MACACKKVQEKQDRLIELNNRIEASQNRIERASLTTQKTIVETQIGMRKNKIFTFLGKLFRTVFFQIPFITVAVVMILAILLVYMIASLIAKVFFNKEIGGIISPFAIYNNIKNSTISKSVENAKLKIEKYRNE